MNLRYLVDTDWVIEHLKGRAKITRQLQLREPEGLGLSIVSLAELYEGVIHSRDPGESERGLRLFLNSVTLIGIDLETCQVFGRERGRLRSEGKLIGDFDLLIGSTALRHGLVLLTNNRRHFEMIDGLQIVS